MIRVLMVEEDALSAELTLRTLRSYGLHCVCDRVVNDQDFKKALSLGPDVILFCTDVQDFNGFAALAIAKSAKSAAPFFFVLERHDEFVARRAVGAGASDYILKSELRRLVAAVRGALRPSVEHERRTRDEI